MPSVSRGAGRRSVSPGEVGEPKLDECRRRVRRTRPSATAATRPTRSTGAGLLTKAGERLDDRGRSKLLGLLEAGDPQGEVRTAWRAKEVVRSIYEITDPALPASSWTAWRTIYRTESCPPEVRQLGRTLRKWRDQIMAWHTAHVSNGPTETVNNLMKRIKRIGVRVPSLRQLPDPGPALRRQARLGPTRHGHPPLKSEEPLSTLFQGRTVSAASGSLARTSAAKSHGCSHAAKWPPFSTLL